MTKTYDIPESVIFLRGNISEGFKAFGPYESFDAAAAAHALDEGWLMELHSELVASET